MREPALLPWVIALFLVALFLADAILLLYLRLHRRSGGGPLARWPGNTAGGPVSGHGGGGEVDSRPVRTAGPHEATDGRRPEPAAVAPKGAGGEGRAACVVQEETGPEPRMRQPAG